jgi:hypothetical protein
MFFAPVLWGIDSVNTERQHQKMRHFRLRFSIALPRLGVSQTVWKKIASLAVDFMHFLFGALGV